MNIPTVPEVPGVQRVKRIKLLGVTIADNFFMEDHVDSVISSSASALYALKILRAHGMGQNELHKVFQATVISRLQYASPSWWGYTTPSQRERFESFLRRSQKFGYYSLDSPNFATICDSADKRCFTALSQMTITFFAVSCHRLRFSPITRGNENIILYCRRK